MLKKVSKQEAVRKLEKYCTYQDRCHQEVHEKLYNLGFSKDDRDEIIAYLIENKFLNEERFARSFVRGHFYLKNWGKLKIINALKSKGINSTLIRIAMEEIDDQDYLKTFRKLAEKKFKEIKDTDSFSRKAKIGRYLSGKGYEFQLITEFLDSLKD